MSIDDLICLDTPTLKALARKYQDEADELQSLAAKARQEICRRNRAERAQQGAKTA